MAGVEDELADRHPQQQQPPPSTWSSDKWHWYGCRKCGSVFPARSMVKSHFRSAHTRVSGYDGGDGNILDIVISDVRVKLTRCSVPPGGVARITKRSSSATTTRKSPSCRKRRTGNTKFKEDNPPSSSSSTSSGDVVHMTDAEEDEDDLEEGEDEQSDGEEDSDDTDEEEDRRWLVDEDDDFDIERAREGKRRSSRLSSRDTDTDDGNRKRRRTTIPTATKTKAKSLGTWTPPRATKETKGDSKTSTLKVKFKLEPKDVDEDETKEPEPEGPVVSSSSSSSKRKKKLKLKKRSSSSRSRRKSKSKSKSPQRSPPRSLKKKSPQLSPSSESKKTPVGVVTATRIDQSLPVASVVVPTKSCQPCDISFNSNPAYDSHMANFHTVYICPVCSTHILSTTECQIHFPTVHQQRISADDVIKYWKVYKKPEETNQGRQEPPRVSANQVNSSSTMPISGLLPSDAQRLNQPSLPILSPLKLTPPVQGQHQSLIVSPTNSNSLGQQHLGVSSSSSQQTKTVNPSNVLYEYWCPYCPRQWTATPQTLASHVYQHHRNAIAAFVCPLCKLQFREPRQVLAHFPVYHPQNVIPKVEVIMQYLVTYTPSNAQIQPHPAPPVQDNSKPQTNVPVPTSMSVAPAQVANSQPQFIVANQAFPGNGNRFVGHSNQSHSYAVNPTLTHSKSSQPQPYPSSQSYPGGPVAGSSSQPQPQNRGSVIVSGNFNPAQTNISSQPQGQGHPFPYTQYPSPAAAAMRQPYVTGPTVTSTNINTSQQYNQNMASSSSAALFRPRPSAPTSTIYPASIPNNQPPQQQQQRLQYHDYSYSYPHTLQVPGQQHVNPQYQQIPLRQPQPHPSQPLPPPYNAAQHYGVTRPTNSYSNVNHNFQIPAQAQQQISSAAAVADVHHQPVATPVIRSTLQQQVLNRQSASSPHSVSSGSPHSYSSSSPLQRQMPSPSTAITPPSIPVQWPSVTSSSSWQQQPTQTQGYTYSTAPSRQIVPTQPTQNQTWGHPQPQAQPAQVYSNAYAQVSVQQPNVRVHYPQQPYYQPRAQSTITTPQQQQQHPQLSSTTSNYTSSPSPSTTSCGFCNHRVPEGPFQQQQLYKHIWETHPFYYCPLCNAQMSLYETERHFQQVHAQQLHIATVISNWRRVQPPVGIVAPNPSLNSNSQNLVTQSSSFHPASGGGSGTSGPMLNANNANNNNNVVIKMDEAAIGRFHNEAEGEGADDGGGGLTIAELNDITTSSSATAVATLTSTSGGSITLSLGKKEERSVQPCAFSTPVSHPNSTVQELPKPVPPEQHKGTKVKEEKEDIFNASGEFILPD